MLLSMTGYATRSFDIKLGKKETVSLAVEIKALNSRFFELNARLPGTLNFLEVELASLLRDRLIRGRVQLNIASRAQSRLFETIVPSLSVAQGYVDSIKKIQKATGIGGEVEVADLLGLPDLFASEKSKMDLVFSKELIAAVSKVAEELTSYRAKEGEALGKDLQKHLEACKNIIKRIERSYKQLEKELKKKIEKLLETASEGDAQKKAELESQYLILNKIDINEEIVRFSSHLDSASSLMKSKDQEKGRRFDFILQELARETNTMAAKCSNFSISSLTVDMKVELEKAREQIQNVV